jgi:hypothetical protein
MTNSNKLRMLKRASHDFLVLSKKAKYKAQIYKFFDFFNKIILSISAALITYFSEYEDLRLLIRILGIVIAVFTAVSSIAMFEKRSLSNIQIYSKCEAIIVEIEEKIEILRNDEDIEENVQEYIRKIFRDLSILNLSSFTDTLFEKMVSKRVLES